MPAININCCRPTKPVAWYACLAICVVANCAGFRIAGVDLAQAAIAAEEKAPKTSATAVQFIRENCLDCHGSGAPEAGLDLESVSLDVEQQTEQSTEVLEKVWRRLASRQMPPADSLPADQRPSEASYAEVTETIEQVLDAADRMQPRLAKVDSLRRLNRSEYQNAIRDLLAVDIDAEALLPPDESSHGFDNITVAELSPTLLNRYVSAAQKIARLAVGIDQGSPGGETYRLPADRTQEQHVDGLPLGTRGGMLVRHTFPQAGEYEVSLRLTRDRDETVEGLNRPHAIDVMIDKALVHQFSVKPPRGGRDFTHVDSHLQTRVTVTAGPHDVGVTFPSQDASLLEIKRQPFDAAYNRHRHPRQSPALFQVSIVGPFPANPKKAGSEQADSEQAGSTPGELAEQPIPSNETREQGIPIDTPSRRKIFAGDPQAGSQESRARAVLEPLMRIAYRRPVVESDWESPLWFFEQARQHDGFEGGIEAALTSILVNPNLLFRVEPPVSEVDHGIAKLSDLELATRLSFFLWSSLPDERLLELAEHERLSDPKVLAGEVDRMLADAKSHSLVTNFAAQWLYLRNLDSIAPDLRLYPDFDDNLRQAFRQETELLFDDMMRHDRSVLDLIASKHTFLNERLAKHYGVPHVLGSHFRRVDLPTGSLRGGILRHGSILTVTSYATRTSPTIRGNWILQNILGTPPPPPPPNVPALPDKSTSSALSMRERLAEHRKNPACAGCHNLMDPIGFSLENFDALGRWRDFEESLPIDAAGELPDGTQIAGVAELEAGILARPEMFAATLTEKLMTFALGRVVELSDGPAIRRIAEQAAQKGFRFSQLIHGIVSSKPFQFKMTLQMNSLASESTLDTHLPQLPK